MVTSWSGPTSTGSPGADPPNPKLLIEVRGKFLQEAAWGVHDAPGARTGSDLGKAQVEFVPRSRHRDVEEPAFLLDVAILDRPPPGKLPVGHADDEDDVVFQALGLV